MEDRFYRTRLLIGDESMEILKNSTVAIFGIGGVGSFTAEALARAGVGNLILIDHDIIDETNINRQIHALDSTIGRAKIKVMHDRILQINPDAKVEMIDQFYESIRAEDFFLNHENLSYVVDAIDFVRGKISLACECYNRKIPIVSAMGAAGKLDPTQFEVTDIFKTSEDPLAKVMRHELRRRGIPNLKVVYSKETPQGDSTTSNTRRSVPGSISFVPSVAGLIIASVVIHDIIERK